MNDNFEGLNKSVAAIESRISKSTMVNRDLDDNIENLNKSVTEMQSKISIVAVVDRDLNNFKQDFQRQVKNLNELIQANNSRQKNEDLTRKLE